MMWEGVGMTWEGVGMMWEGVGMMWEGAGMAWEGVGMMWEGVGVTRHDGDSPCGASNRATGDSRLRGNDGGGCGNDETRRQLSGRCVESRNGRFPPTRE